MRYGIRTHDMDYERARVRSLEELAERWAGPDAGPVTLADLPPGDEDEGIYVIDLIEAILDNWNETYVVIVPNRGAIPNLPDDAIVEANALVNAYGVHPIQTGPLPEALAAHLHHYAAVQHHMVKAALTGDRQAALHAFLLDPTLQARLDTDQTKALLDEMLAANAEHLPLLTQRARPSSGVGVAGGA
jgi:alpha-galactosidase/6-phospho-beta-glucosidase family protein